MKNILMSLDVNETAKSKGTLKQNLIITFSRKMMEYQREIRRRQIERAEKNHCD